MKLKLLKTASIALFVAGGGRVLWSIGIQYQYADSLPRSPHPATGSLYPLNMHGVVVYQTLKERSRLDDWSYWSWGIIILSFVLGLIHEWRSRKPWER